METLENWALEELETLELGDKRLNRRCESLLTTLSTNPKESIPVACKSWAETIAAYRFLDNVSVTPEKILAPHQKATLARVKAEEVVLMVQDTTEIKYQERKPIKGLGKMSYPLEQGLHLHPTLAITPEKVCLGVIDKKTWIREALGEKPKRRQKKIEDKESYCWIESYRASDEVAKACPNTLIVNVSDREGDIYELFLEREESEENQAHWLIRSSQNRRLLNPKTKEPLMEKLYDRANKAPVLGQMKFELSGTAGRKARTVKQEIRGRRICIRPPYNKGVNTPTIEATIIVCRETKPPKGEEPIEWFLLTSVPLDTPERGLQIVQWYLCRWQIEIFFKTLKTGCEIEELQLQSYERIVNCLALYMVVSWRILYVTMLGRNNPDIACDLVFSKDEWNAVYAVVHKKNPPKKPPRLYDMIRMVASLGGFLGRKRDGEPGPQSMWIGMQRMNDFAIAWPIFRGLK